MPPLNKRSLLAALIPPLDKRLTEQLLDEFVSMERRFVLREWEPATLDGGQFAEASAKIVYHQDSGTLNRRKGVNPCLNYVEDPNNCNVHSFPDRKAALHLARVIRSVYKFRSDRGAVHIDPTYTANQLDSKLVLENARWILAELMRIFWNGNRAEVSCTIRHLIQYDIPAVGVFGERLVVQRTDCSAEEEVLILLHYAGERGMSRKKLGQPVMRSPSSITKALGALTAPDRREITQLDDGSYCLTDCGIRKVLSELGEKLVL